MTVYFEDNCLILVANIQRFFFCLLCPRNIQIENGNLKFRRVLIQCQQGCDTYLGGKMFSFKPYTHYSRYLEFGCQNAAEMGFTSLKGKYKTKEFLPPCNIVPIYLHRLKLGKHKLCVILKSVKLKYNIILICQIGLIMVKLIFLLFVVVLQIFVQVGKCSVWEMGWDFFCRMRHKSCQSKLSKKLFSDQKLFSP